MPRSIKTGVWIDDMKKKDMILISVILLIAPGSLAAVHLLQGQAGAQVNIYIDGDLEHTLPLSEDRELEIDNSLGYNKIVVSGGQVRVTQADCPDKICVHHAAISHDKETIVCLPHKLVVEIEGGEDSGTDAGLR